MEYRVYINTAQLMELVLKEMTKLNFKTWCYGYRSFSVECENDDLKRIYEIDGVKAVQEVKFFVGW